MHRLGQFLELIVPTEDIQASLAFYRALGFTELVVGEVRQHFYAVVTDGRIAIGLHGDLFEEPALAFLRSDVAGWARDRTEPLEFQRTGSHQFNEVALRSPGRHLAIVAEAPTFVRSPMADAPAPLAGRIAEVNLRSTDFAADTRFWETLGCITDDTPDADSVRLYATGVTLRLRDDLRWREPLLRFSGASVDLAELLAPAGVECTTSAHGSMIVAPEGTRLLID